MLLPYLGRMILGVSSGFFSSAFLLSLRFHHHPTAGTSNAVHSRCQLPLKKCSTRWGPVMVTEIEASNSLTSKLCKPLLMHSE